MLQSLLRNYSKDVCKRCVDTSIKNGFKHSIKVSVSSVFTRSFYVSCCATQQRAKGSDGPYSPQDYGAQTLKGFFDENVKAVIPTKETHEMLVDGVPFKELPVAYVRSSSNNTIVTVTNHNGQKIISYSSGGLEGFRNVKKSSDVAAQAAGMSAGYRAHRQGTKNIRVIIKGLGQGRLPAMTGLKKAGLNIVSLTDNTPVPSNGPKPRKKRRV